MCGRPETQSLTDDEAGQHDDDDDDDINNRFTVLFQ